MQHVMLTASQSRGSDWCLQVTYQSTGNLAIQDAIGQCILGAARVVPDGMLVFLSSYSLLDRLMLRWKACLMIPPLRRSQGCLWVLCSGSWSLVDIHLLP